MKKKILGFGLAAVILTSGAMASGGDRLQERIHRDTTDRGAYTNQADRNQRRATRREDCPNNEEGLCPYGGEGGEHRHQRDGQGENRQEGRGAGGGMMRDGGRAGGAIRGTCRR